MDNKPQTWIAHACHRLLRPLVRILLRHGVAYDDFAEVTKSVYVEVARESCTPAGKRPTDARVAIVTGMTRKEVKRLREAADDGYAAREWGGANRATRVLSGWYRDPAFTDRDGEPRPLDPDSGFPWLVRRYSGDIPASAVLAELERVGAIVRDGGHLRPQRRAYVPDAGDPESLRMLGSATHDLLATIEHNLGHDPEKKPRFQRTVFNSRIDARALPVFHRLVSEQGQQLLEVLEDWLEQHEIEGEAAGDTTRAGVGLYYFRDPSDFENES